jgi:hypothetical protein
MHEAFRVGVGFFVGELMMLPQNPTPTPNIISDTGFSFDSRRSIQIPIPSHENSASGHRGSVSISARLFNAIT